MRHNPEFVSLVVSAMSDAGITDSNCGKMFVKLRSNKEYDDIYYWWLVHKDREECEKLIKKRLASLLV